MKNKTSKDMKKYLFLVPLVIAASVSCSKETPAEDTTGADQIIYVKDGISIVADAEMTKVTVTPVGEEGSYTGSQMAWEVGDRIKVYHDGKVGNFVTATAGTTATFNPVTPADVIYTVNPSKPVIAYYNVTSVNATNGQATFSIPAEQTEGQASNKVPLYAYSATPDMSDKDNNRVNVTFKPLASVLEFKVDAGITTSDEFSYYLDRVVLTPKTGATGWMTMTSGTVNPATGAITPASSSLSALTYNFANSTNIVGGSHFQMVVGACKMDNTGATMDWYKKKGNEYIQNYTKTIWASKDVDFATPIHAYQPIAQKVVGLANYSDYYSNFYANRTSQDNFINYCDDERTMILTGDIIMTGSAGNRAVCIPNLTWNFDGKGHYIYKFDVENDASGQNRIYGFFSGVQANIKNVNFGGKGQVAVINLTDSADSRGGRYYGAITDVQSGTIENVTSYIDYTLSLSKNDKQYIIGGVVGYMSGGTLSGCHNRGTITVSHNTSYNVYVGGVVGSTNAASISISGSQNHANIAVTKDGSGALYAGGVIAYQRGTNVSNCLNDATSFTLAMTGTGQAFAGGILGSTGSEVMTISGLVNAANVSVTRSGAGDAYTAGILGQPWCLAGTTFSGCENRGNISFESTYNDTHDVQWKTGGLIGRLGSSQGVAVSNCVNYGNVTADAAVAPTSGSKYTVAGLIADFQQGSSMANCVQRGSVVYAKVNGEYAPARACWLAAWTVLDNVTATPSASVLKGITVNGVTIDESNYTKKNIWAPQNAPSAGVLVLLSDSLASAVSEGFSGTASFTY